MRSYELYGLRQLFTFGWLKPKVNLAVESVDGRKVSIALGSYEYEAGQKVTITVTPSSGYNFEMLEVAGSQAGTSTTLTITMDRCCTVTSILVFTRIPMICT